MGTLTLADYKSRVLLTLNNVPTAHPVMAAGMHVTAINNAPNRLIRENPALFPEHHNRSWTIGPTAIPDAGPPVVEGNRIPIPENLLVLEKVRQNGDSVNPGTWASITENVVTMPSGGAELIGLMQKDSDVTGYPIICARKDSDLMYYPTTRTGFTCYFRLYGISRELPLENDDDVFVMDRDWDQVIVLLAASETAEALGWAERAQELLAMAGSRIKQRGGVVARERAMRPNRVTIAGMLGGNYGRF